MAIAAKLLRYEEMLDMPQNTDLIEEVIDGEIRTMPPNKENHALVIENLADLMRSVLPQRSIVVRTTNFGLLIRKNQVTCRVPDLAVFVLGVPEVWLLSSKQRTFEVRQLKDGGLVTVAVRSSGQIAPKLFPQASIDIDAIWPL